MGIRCNEGLAERGAQSLLAPLGGKKFHFFCRWRRPKPQTNSDVSLRILLPPQHAGLGEPQHSSFWKPVPALLLSKRSPGGGSGSQPVPAQPGVPRAQRGGGGRGCGSCCSRLLSLGTVRCWLEHGHQAPTTNNSTKRCEGGLSCCANTAHHVLCARGPGTVRWALRHSRGTKRCGQQGGND